MVDRAIIDLLTYGAERLAEGWKDRVRRAEQLKAYNALSDEVLVDINADLYRALDRWFGKGRDTNALGTFFVELGKKRQAGGFPVSEVLYAMILAERTLGDRILEEVSLENSIQLYQLADATRRISEFFLLGSYYLVKGYLEETYLGLNEKESVPADLLKRYFKDDFFFK